MNSYQKENIVKFHRGTRMSEQKPSKLTQEQYDRLIQKRIRFLTSRLKLRLAEMRAEKAISQMKK